MPAPVEEGGREADEAEPAEEELLELGFSTQLTAVQQKYKGKLAQKLREVRLQPGL